jgi:hypothetical protein
MGTTTPATCPEPRCDPANPPEGFFCLDDPAIGCGLICTDPTFCPGTTEAPNTLPPPTTNLARRTTPSRPTYTCGFYLPTSTRREAPCRSRYYCPSGPTPSTPIVPVICPAGYHCPEATCTPIPCPCGTKCPEGSPAPITCQPPFYCPDPLASNQTLCPIGYKCDKPAMCNATACPPGTFVTCAGKVTCDACPAGRYCPVPTSSILCPAGYYCPIDSSAPALCPAGRYCPLGSAEPAPCPPPTTSPAGSTSSLQCVRAAEGGSTKQDLPNAF